METIKYYGNDEKSSKKIVGSLAKMWMSIDRNKLSNSGFYVPYIEFLSQEECQNINQHSFDWPICVWISAGDDLNVPRHNISNIKDFKNLVDLAEKFHAKFSFAIIKPKFSPYYHSNLGPLESHIFIANDLIIIRDKISESQHFQTISFPLKAGSLFNYGLNDKYLYKFSMFTANNLIFDGIYDKKCIQIDNEIGRSALEASDEELRNFSYGFKNGYMSKSSNHISHVLNTVIQLPKDNYFAISRNSESAFQNGYFLGKLINWKITQEFSSIDNGSIFTKENLSISNAESAIKKYSIISSLTNAIFSDNISKVKNCLNELSISDFWVSPCVSENPILSALNIISHWKRDQSLCEDYYNIHKTTINVNLPEIDSNFTILNNVKFFEAKFRILNKTDDCVNLRFQVQKINLERKLVFDKGSEIMLNLYEKDGLEHDQQILNCSEEYINSIQNLKFYLSSNAGTSQKYAPVEIENDNLIAKESGLVICSKSKFLNMFGIN